MKTPELRSLRERIGDLDIKYWPADPNRMATEDVFYINTPDKEIFDLFNRACKAIDEKRIILEGMEYPLDLVHQIGTTNTIGETGYELQGGRNLPANSGLQAVVFALIREKMLELSGK